MRGSRLVTVTTPSRSRLRIWLELILCPLAFSLQSSAFSLVAAQNMAGPHPLRVSLLVTCAEKLSSRVHEFSQFLMGVLGVEDIGATDSVRVTQAPHSSH